MTVVSHRRAPVRRVRPGPRADSGFTLLECLASIVIIGSALVAGLGLFEIHDRVYTTQADSYEARAFLERELEYVRVLDWDALETTGFVPLPEDSDYEVRRVVTSVDAVTNQITVEIRWTSELGNPRTESLITLRVKGVG